MEIDSSVSGTFFFQYLEEVLVHSQIEIPQRLMISQLLGYFLIKITMIINAFTKHYLLIKDNTDIGKTNKKIKTTGMWFWYPYLYSNKTIKGD